MRFGSEVIVPNGTIISNKVTNWTFSDRYRAVEVPVSVARGVAPLRVVEVFVPIRPGSKLETHSSGGEIDNRSLRCWFFCYTWMIGRYTFQNDRDILAAQSIIDRDKKITPYLHSVLSDAAP
jgi:hypothetical protein